MNICSIIFAVIMLFLVLWLVLEIVILFKNENTYKQHTKILEAISAWWEVTHNTSKAIEYMQSLEKYSKTLYRLWDWGCRRIVPKDVYDEIKPYIGQKGKNR